MTHLHFDAGKYAAYFWPAYGISVLVLGGLVMESLGAARRWRRRAEGQGKPGGEDV